MEQRGMVKFLIFPKRLWVVLCMPLSSTRCKWFWMGVEEGTKVQMLPFGPRQCTIHNCNRVELPKCKGMFTMFERKFHPHFFMSLNYQYECLFSSSLQVRRGCLAKWKVLDNEGAPSCGEEVPQVPYPRPPVPPHISHFLIKYIKPDPCSTLDNPSSK